MKILNYVSNLAQILKAELVCVGAKADADTLKRFLEIQNPGGQKRGGLGFGLYASLDKAAPESPWVNINVFGNSAARSHLELRVTDWLNCEIQISNAGETITTGKFFVPPTWVRQTLPAGRPLGEIFQQHFPGQLVGVLGPTRCSLFDAKNACAFCSMDGGINNAPRSIDEILQALEIILPANPQYHLTLTTALVTGEDFREQILPGITELKTKFPNLNLALEIQPITEAQITAIARAGLDTLMIPLDVSHPSNQARYVPGKMQALGAYWNSVAFAVETFGIGNVTSPIIVGLEPLPTTLEAIRGMIDLGVLPEPVPVRTFDDRISTSTSPDDFVTAGHFTRVYAAETRLLEKMQHVKAGCATCGGCNGFTLRPSQQTTSVEPRPSHSDIWKF